MDLSRWTKRIVAGVTGMALLLYLATAVAHACVPNIAGPHDSVMSEPCCEAAVAIKTSVEPDCCQAHYSSQPTMPEATKIAALTAVELPMIATRVDAPLYAEYVTASATSPPVHASSPPLHTLYCRLRN